MQLTALWRRLLLAVALVPWMAGAAQAGELVSANLEEAAPAAHSTCGGCGQCSNPCDAADYCGGADCGLFDSLFGGLVARSDRRFAGFISPMTNPVFFEDPRINTEAKFLFLQQKIPLAAGSGDVQLYGVQVQAALTDRLSIVADKDGFIVSQNPLVDDGWADVAVGLKYLLLADACRQRLLSVGVSYELPVGTPRALQGNGDGEFHLYLTGAALLADRWRWISGSGFRLPSDPAAESRVWYWSNHVSYQLSDMLYVLSEFNWYHWMGAGQQTALAGVEGGDLINLGSVGVAGNDIVTGAIGLKLKPHAGMEIGVAWEVPLTRRRDLLENRLTVDWILRY